MVTDGCFNLYDEEQKNDPPNWWTGTYALSRWFQQPADYFNGGLHIILGHRAIGYTDRNTGSDFFSKSIGGGETVYNAWRDAVYYDEYMWWGWDAVEPGVEPAALAAIDSTGRQYENETIHNGSSWPDPSSNPGSSVDFTYTYYGTPQFDSWLSSYCLDC